MLFDHDFGPRSDHRQEGKRPALVVQTDVLNHVDGYPNVIVVPLTTKQKGAASYVQIAPSDRNGLTSQSWAITNQIFTIHKDHLKNSIGRISRTELYAVKQALKLVLDIA